MKNKAAEKMRETHRVTGDKWFLKAAEEIERMQSAIVDAVDAMERGSTSAPVLESLKAALTGCNTE